MSVDGDIRELKGELAGLARSVDQLGAQLGAKIDILVAMQVQLGRMQEQTDQNRQAIDRAFSDIRDNEELSKETDSKVNKAISFVRGLMMAGALLFAFAQWYTIGRLDVIDATSEKLAIIDRRLSWIEVEVGRLPTPEGSK